MRKLEGETLREIVELKIEIQNEWQTGDPDRVRNKKRKRKNLEWKLRAKK